MYMHGVGSPRLNKVRTHQIWEAMECTAHLGTKFSYGGACRQWWEKNWKVERLLAFKGLPGGSTGKESISNSGDPGSIPGLGRSTGERTGYPLQYSWSSLLVQLINNLPAVWKT